MSFRKAVVGSAPMPPGTTSIRTPIDLERTARVEVTSEDPARPVEGALALGAGGGWLAGHAGPQTIRLVFDSPQAVRSVELVFEEPETTRTQEFVLRGSKDGAAFRDIVRQQWNFSPAATREVEVYAVDLRDVAALELSIVPDISGGSARASLARWRVG